MTLQQLKYFRAMAEVLHYTRTAQMLFVSQSSLSYSITELEKELGAPLFEKRGNTTILTKYGEDFLPFARQALDNIDEGVLRIEKMLVPPSSVINLGYIYSLSFDFLPRVLTEFRSQPGNNDITFNFFQGSSTAISDKLKKAELEIALTVETNDEQLESVQVYEQELFLVVPSGHKFSGKTQVMLDEMKDETFVSINPNSSLRKYVDNVFRSVDLSPRIKFEAEECNAMASFVSARFGIAIMPEIPALHSYGVEVIPIADRQFVRKLHLVWVKNRPLTPVAGRFRDYFLKESVCL